MEETETHLNWLDLLAAMALVFFLAMTQAGCAMMQSQPPQLTDYSDTGVLNWSNQVMSYWGDQTGGSDVLGYGGALSMAGLTSGTLLATASGASAAPGLAFGSAVVSWVLAILKPTGHGNAVLAGATDVLSARQQYFQDRTAAGISRTPNNCMTRYAGTFAGKIDAAISKWLRLKQELAPADPQPPVNQGMVAGRTATECGQ